ncbi:7569_t:CDS:2, partial [Funneliformis geosporum]
MSAYHTYLQSNLNLISLTMSNNKKDTIDTIFDGLTNYQFARSFNLDVDDVEFHGSDENLESNVTLKPDAPHLLTSTIPFE